MEMGFTDVLCREGERKQVKNNEVISTELPVATYWIEITDTETKMYIIEVN